MDMNRSFDSQKVRKILAMLISPVPLFVMSGTDVAERTSKASLRIIMIVRSKSICYFLSILVFTVVPVFYKFYNTVFVFLPKIIFECMHTLIMMVANI